MLQGYLQNLTGITNRGDAREESYYGTLEKLIKEFASSIPKKNTLKASLLNFGIITLAATRYFANSLKTAKAATCMIHGITSTLLPHWQEQLNFKMR